MTRHHIASLTVLAAASLGLFASAALAQAPLASGYPPAAPIYGSEVPAPVYVDENGVVTSGYQPVYGQPSAIPEPIRAPAAPLSTQEVFGYDDLGRQGFAEGDPSKAEFNFEKALEVNPFDPVALNNLAVAKAERGQFHEAMGLLDRASKLDPNNADVAANLARLRGYVQGYAMAGMEPVLPKAGSGPLPPAPPALWSALLPASYSSYPGPVPSSYQTQVYVPAVRSETLAAPSTVPSTDYYLSEACVRKPVRGKKGKFDIDCQPQR